MGKRHNFTGSPFGVNPQVTETAGLLQTGFLQFGNAVAICRPAVSLRLSAHTPVQHDGEPAFMASDGNLLAPAIGRRHNAGLDILSAPAPRGNRA
jgi:hypothetical protein